MPKRAAKNRNNSTGKLPRLSQVGKYGPAAHKDAVKKANALVARLDRQRTAWELFVGGATLQQIGDRFGLSAKTAYYDVVEHRERMIQTGALEDVEVLRTRHLSRLDSIHRAHYPKRHTKDSADVLLGVLSREAKLLGLDKRQEGGYSGEQVLALVRGMVNLFLEVVADPELRRAYATGVRRQLGGIVKDIPVTPKKDGEDT